MIKKIQACIEAFRHGSVNVVEAWLEHREKAKIKAEKTQQRYVQKFGKWGAKVADWGMAFLWAAVWVFFINQYLVQAYVIPSESMVPALQVGDRVFVNKLMAGPELLPGYKKMLAFVEPKRGQIIIFSNPALDGGHPATQVIHRLVYMLTLSLVDIGGRGNLPQLLVKRAVGADGDQIVFRDGNLYIRPRGADRFYSEAEFQKLTGLSYHVRRIVPAESIETNRGKAAYRAYQLALTTSSYPPNMAPPAEFSALEMQYTDFSGYDTYDPGEQAARYTYLSTLYGLMPYDQNVKEQLLQEDLGYYVALGRFLPLGDNRDNSQDGRYFGSIAVKNVLGYSLWRFYPFNRLGGVE